MRTFHGEIVTVLDHNIHVRLDVEKTRETDLEHFIQTHRQAA